MSVLYIFKRVLHFKWCYAGLTVSLHIRLPFFLCAHFSEALFLRLHNCSIVRWKKEKASLLFKQLSANW